MKILFVCLGNICRSPLAEGIFEARAEAAGLPATCDSAGTGGWHVGSPPDRRGIAVAKARGIDISVRRARQIVASDFDGFDWILAMDQQNLSDINAMRPEGCRAQVALFLEPMGDSRTDVPDPYYSGDFEPVCDLVIAGCDAWIARMSER